ncbi:serine hydrolase domain-containing protein [Deinococcus sp.]|uniref:serine hydrolase domain-containing protein n=1 Tax=Deinococcus sp. TaxID=47478 RepID=UPI003B5A3E67
MFGPDAAARTAQELAAAFPDLNARLLGPLLRRTLRPGGVAAIWQDGKQVISGLRQNAEASFEIASVTKPFTAALAFALAQQGRLELDRPLARQFAGFRGYPPHITARALLTHTAGLPLHPLRGNLGTLLDFHDPYGRLSAAQVLASGRRWAWAGSGRAGRLSYSNFGYSLLALALAEAVGEPYPAALERWILNPLALSRTGFLPTAPLARPHGLLGSQRISGFGGLIGAGGLFGTAHDLLRFGEAHLSGQVRGWANVSQLRGMPPPLLGVAGGWLVTRWRKEAVWWHDGVARGTRTALGFSPDTGRVAAVLIASGVPLVGRGGPGAVLAQLF